MSDIIDKLSAAFDPEDVRQRDGRGGMKLDYIGIDTTINRLNEVVPGDWSFDLDKVELTDTDEGKYLALVSGHMSVTIDEHKVRTAGGVGASVGTDADDAVKTALAEAIKKAGHQFGIGLYLWDPKERAIVEEYRRQKRGGKARRTLDEDANTGFSF